MIKMYNKMFYYYTVTFTVNHVKLFLFIEDFKN